MSNIYVMWHLPVIVVQPYKKTVLISTSITRPFEPLVRER